MNQMNIEECREMLLKLGMNRFKVDEWYEYTQSSDIDVTEYDNIIFYFACNIDNQDGYASKNASTTFLALIESTIYERIKDQRLMGKLDVYTAVGLSTVVQSITNATSLDEKVINMFITLVITEVIKIGVNAWCKHYELKKTDEGEE